VCAQALLPNLLHQHSRVRLAVLAGLRALVLSGLPAGMLESQVAPAIQQLSADHTASVREAYYAALAAWLDCGADSHQQQDGQEAAAAAAHARCRTHAPVLLPLLLLGVSDAQPSVAAATLRAVEAAGAAWQLQPAAATAAEAAGGEAVPMETDAAAGADGGLHVLPAAVAAAQLPPPYQGLPSEASRQMVAALLPQLLPQVLAGLREWTISLRSAAARCVRMGPGMAARTLARACVAHRTCCPCRDTRRLLHTCCVLGGPAAAPHLPQLLPGLVAALSDDEPDIVARLASSCRLLGAFVPPPAWLPLLVDALTDPRASPGGRASALVVTACMAHAAAAAAQPAEPALLAALVSGLASDDVLAADHAGLQAQLLIVTRNLLDWMPEAVVMQCRQQLYLVLLQLYGAAAAAPGSGAAAQPQQPGSSHSQTDNVAAVMQLLAQRTGLPGGAAQLAAQHARALLPLLTADAAKWGSASPHLVAFTALLRTAGPDCLAELLPEVALVLQPVLADADREPGLRLALLTLLDDLLEGRDTAPAFVGSEAAALLTLTHLLMPPLVWRAGKVRGTVSSSVSACCGPTSLGLVLTCACCCPLHYCATGRCRCALCRCYGAVNVCGVARWRAAAGGAAGSDAAAAARRAAAAARGAWPAAAAGPAAGRGLVC
jgi:dynein assembly factor 5